MEAGPENWLMGEGVDKTIKILLENSFKGERTFMLLSESDICALKIEPLAQRKLLVDLVKSGMPVTSQQTNVTAGKDKSSPQLEDLFRSLPSAGDTQRTKQLASVTAQSTVQVRWETLIPFSI